MQGLRPRQLARIGMVYLEEAVLDVLSEAKRRGQCLEPNDISKRCGIHSTPTIRGLHYAIIHGILHKLSYEDRVLCNEKSEWTLTDKEFEER